MPQGQRLDGEEWKIYRLEIECWEMYAKWCRLFAHSQRVLILLFNLKT